MSNTKEMFVNREKHKIHENRHQRCQIKTLCVFSILRFLRLSRLQEFLYE